MKLNPDCIRDILLTVEDNTDFSTAMFYSDEAEYEHLIKYSYDEVIYHINQCELSGLVTEVSWMCGGRCNVVDISPQGHEFLANIRSDTTWSKVKETAEKVGSFSLDALTKISIGVVTALINKHI